MNGDTQIGIDEIVHETDNAMLIKFEGQDVWVPLSRISRIERGKSPAIWVPKWLANKKGFL